MRIEVDQSGKIEQTELDTVIAFSNKVKFVLVLKKRTKRILQAIFRQNNKPRMFIYKTFAALIVIVLKETKPKTKVVIDTEYSGHEDLLKIQIKEYYSLLLNKDLPSFEFGYVGKKSTAHILAGKVAAKVNKANKIVALNELVKIIWPKKMIGYPRIRRTEGNLTQE